MLKYILGLIKFLFNPAVSLFARVDNLSTISKKARIHRKAKIFNSKIDSYTYVGVGASIVFAEIGKFCSIAGNTIVGMGIHTLDKMSTSPIFTEKYNALGHSWCNDTPVYPFKKVKVGNDVWIGARVMVMGGVSIGDGAVIGAGAIVTKDVPPYAIVAGVPAKIIRYRFSPEIIERLEEIRWWNLSEENLKKKTDLFKTNNLDIDVLNNLL